MSLDKNLGTLSLQSKIAAALGWSLSDVQSFSLPAIREMVRLNHPNLAEEISESIRYGYHLKK